MEKRLGGRHRLPEPEEVDEELRRVARARAADVDQPVGVADHPEQAPMAFEDLDVAADDEAEGAGARPVGVAADRGVEDVDAALGRALGHLPAHPRGRAREVDPRGSRAQAGERAAGAEERLPDLQGPRQAGQEDVGLGRDGDVRRSPAGAGGSRRGCPLRPEVAGRDGVARRHEVHAHRQAHPPEPEEADAWSRRAPRDLALPPLILAGAVGARPRGRRRAAPRAGRRGRVGA